MGVTGLWTLVDSAGHPVNLETLHNQVIAIDLSLWINQSIKGIRGKNGGTVDNAHVLGLFNRICKLLFYRIKPVFVFDGKSPQLKQNTLAKRAEQRLKAVDKSREASIKILHNYIATQLSSTQQILPTNKSLPSLQSSLLQLSDNKSFKIYEELNQIEKSKQLNDVYEESDSDSEPDIAQNYQDIQNFDSMDLNSDQFQSLPPEIKYEILTEMKLKFKGYRNTQIMPKETNDFSDYQLKRLLKKRSLQSKIEDTIKELNGEHSEDIIQDWDKSASYDPNGLSAGRLMSDERTRFIFFKKSQKPTEEFKDVINDSVSSVDINSIDNSDNYITDSKDTEPTDDLQRDSSTQPSNNRSNIEINISSDKSMFEKTIEISDESDFEELKPEDELKPIASKQSEQTTDITEENQINTKKPEDSVSKKDVSTNRKLNVKVIVNDSIKEIDVKSEDKNLNRIKEYNELTKIKPKTTQLNNDSDDEDFIEVLPQTYNSSDKEFSDNELQNQDLNESEIQTIDSNEDSINLDEFYDIQDSKPIKEGSTPLKECISEEPKPSTSKPIEFKAISREEMLETCREANKQNRFANHTTDQMMTDCQELLTLFGIPFVLSPMEAEAQCAALEEIGLTSGTITDDSDVLLFGAQTVYKNFFTSSKYVELFKASDIESRFGLSRSSMICIGMLCGSDYTDGVDGVGAVTATEILSEFRGEGLQPLIDLKNWWQKKQNSSDKRPENKMRAKLMKLKLNDSFPNKVVFEAYMNPTVDTSTEKFVWGMPQLDQLRRYAALRFGWTVEKTDSILLPIMKKVNEKQTQMTIDSYFKIQVQPKDTALVSKRINTAINKLKGIESEPQTSQQKSKPGLSVLSQKVKNQRKRRQTKTSKTQTIKNTSKRRQTSSKARAQEINLSESSESE